MTPVSLTTVSQITAEQLQSVLACALQPGSVSCVCCESHVASGIFTPAFSKWQSKTSSLRNTNEHCLRACARTHTHTRFHSVEQTWNEKILKGSFLQRVLDTHRK